MDRISIVIVSYNVRYFLRQCLQSVYNSRINAELEVIVVDNASSDGSVELLRNEFPQVKCIANAFNLGFSKANNQAFEILNGNYVLILNPDTIIEENCLQICLDHYKSDPDIGAIGVKMLDGAGKYLPESKRGFPTPLRSLFKISGLAKLFESSSFFNGYYLGQLSNDEMHDVDVLTGAFVFTQKTTLDAIGGFDEDYFMYGEDIELCYQIKNTGKKIRYLPETSIIHFKGESTRKSSLNYLKRFYGAMQIYASKRNSSSSWPWKLILNLGILTAGIGAVIKNLMNFLIWPAVNFLALFGLTKGIQWLWANYYYRSEAYYNDEHIDISITVLCAALVVCYYVFGQFDRRYTIKQWLYASCFSILGLLALYGLFPLDWRFSRSILLILLFVAPFAMYFMRCLYNKLSWNSFSFDPVSDRRIVIIGAQESYEQLRSVIQNIYSDTGFIARVFRSDESDSIGSIHDLPKIIKSRDINELIFCSRDLSTEDIFRIIAKAEKNLNFKIASKDNRSVLGSNSKNTMGEWFTSDIEFKVKRAFHRRTKRIIDLIFSVLFLVLFPLVLIFSRKRKDVYSNLASVVLGNMTWISYDMRDAHISELPKLKNAVFAFKNFEFDTAADRLHNLNLYYARNYSVWLEMDQLIRNVFSLK